MATQAQIDANRANAKKSTGPRTAEGKARVARNRTTHALTGAHVVLATESVAAYDDLLAALVEELRPQTETESFQVEQMAQAQWRLRRASRMEANSLDHVMGPTDELMRLSRYESAARRAYYKALAELRRLQDERRERARAQFAAALDRALDPEPAETPDPTANDNSNPIPPTAAPGPEAQHTPGPATGPRSGTPVAA